MIRSGALALILTLLVCSACIPPSYAQEDEPENQAPAEDPCQAQPEETQPPERQPGAADQGQERDETQAQLLDRCNGVLTPPDVGEPEMVEPPPDVGRTPVIRPDELPRQQPGPEGRDTEGG